MGQTGSVHTGLGLAYIEMSVEAEGTRSVWNQVLQA